MATLEAVGRAIDRVGDMILKHTIGGMGSQPDKYEQAEDRLRTMYIGAQRKRINKMQQLLQQFTPDYHNCKECRTQDCKHAGEDNPTVCQLFRSS